MICFPKCSFRSARQGQRPSQRDRGSNRTGSQPRPAHPPASDRERAARAPRLRAGLVVAEVALSLLGIRMALGASVHDVMRLVLVQGLRWVGLGLLLGVAGAFALARVLRVLLYGVSPADPTSFAVAAALLAVTATLALVLP